MMKIKHLILAAAALAGLAACKPEEQVIVADSVKLQSATIAFSIASEVKSVGVEANVDWTATTDQSWAHVSPSSGTSATTSISIMVDENTTGAAREATLTVKAGTASATAKITQSGEAISKNDIYTAEGFLEFLTDSAPQATEDDDFKLHADIDLGGAVIAPVSVFAGTLDGQDHKVYNYKVESSQPTAGLILTNNGTVKNLILGSKDGKAYDGTSVVTFVDGTEEISHIGGVCANNAGTISNVKQFARVVAIGKNAALAGLGGIAGVAEQSGTISNCENYASLQAPEANGAEYYIAGILAYTNSGEVLVENCVNKASIDVSMYITKATMIGGIAGRGNSGARFIDCRNDAPISYTQVGETNGNYMMIAGVVGALYTGSQAVRCINKAPVTSTLNQVSRIGGIVGTLNSKGIVEECVNDGDVTLHPAGPIPNWESAGGIVGFEEKQESGNIIRNNTNNGKVTVDVEIAGTHANNRVHAGGILGLGNLGVEIYGNTNNGEVSATNRATGDGNAAQIEAGGICGGLRGGTSYSQDNVNNAKVSGTSTANAMVGGVIGHTGSLVAAADDTSIQMTGDKNFGAVTGSDAAKTGSVVGVNAAILTECTAAGSVNGVTLDDSNFVKLAVGTNTGKIENLKSPSGGSASATEISVEPAEIRVAADATSASFTVTSNAAWTVSCPADWVTSFTKSGNGNGTIEVAFPAYTSTEADREAEFTVTAEGADPIKVKLIQSKVLDSAPHAIISAEELQLFALESKNATPDFARWKNTSGVVTLTADIDASSIASLQIGSIPEGEVIDGGGHKIYNVTSVSTEANSGLILTNTGTVKNLIVGSKDGSAYDGVSAIRPAEGKGGFIGLVAVNNGRLENVTNFATIDYVAGKETAEFGIAGIAGTAGAGSSITSCVNKAEIKIAGNVAQVADVAGIVGFMPNAEAQVIGCTNEAPIIVKAKINKVFHTGGIVGRINALASVSNCQNKADIAYDQQEAPATWMSIGGVIGSNYNGGTVSGCTNYGNVSANSLQVVRIGGVAGVLNKSGKFENCTNEGTVTLTQAANNNWQSVGGVIGFQEASQTNDKDNIIVGCVNKGAVMVSIENATTHANCVGVGGILGEGCLALSVKNNTNSAPVSVTNAAAGAVYAGGIFGALIKNKQPIETGGNVNTGNVSAATSDNAKAMAGGVIGYIAGASGSDANTVAPELTGDKSVCAVTCANAAMVGALAGNNASGKLTNCIAGGSVNGTAVTSANLESLAQGSASAGTVTGSKLAE